MKRGSQPTWTSLVVAALRDRDDFLNYRMLRDATGGSMNQISAACHSLRKLRVVDAIIEPDGRAWWYLLPPEEDQRQRIVEERVPESKPRKPRKPKAKQ